MDDKIQGIHPGYGPGGEAASPAQREVAMAGSSAGLVIVMLAVFLGGIVLGVVGVVSVAIRREERRLTLFSAAPGAMALGARHLTGLAGRGITVPQRSRGQQA
jgi:hypothetical protein